MVDGRYNDGRKAEAHDVEVIVERAVVILRDADGLTKARWPLNEIAWLGDERFGRGDERLSLSDGASARALRRRLAKPSKRGLWRGLGIGAGALVAVVLFFWFGLPLLAAQVAALVPEEWETRSGVWLERQLVTHLAGNRVCAGSSGRAALDAMTARLTAAGAPRLPLTVTVLDSSVVNAFALPGGRIVVFRGLLDFVRHPNEIAGVLAHEMAHADLRHPTEVAIKRLGGALVVSLLTGDVLGGSVFGFAAASAISNSYSREAEREADARALATMRAADLDPAPMAAFFERLAERETRLGPVGDALSFLSTHPDSDQRAATMRAAGGKAVVLPPEEWRALKAICGGGR